MTATSQPPVASPLARHLRWETLKPSAATFWPWLIGITATAFLLRILYMLTIAPPLFGLADEAFYYHASDLIVQGHGYSQPLIAVFYGIYRPTALHPPLWSGVLSIVSLFTAPANDTAGITGTAVDVHRAVTCLCGAAVVLFVGLIGRRIGGWRVGLVGAAIATLYPHFITLDGDLMSEPLYGAIVGGLVPARATDSWTGPHEVAPSRSVRLQPSPRSHAQRGCGSSPCSCFRSLGRRAETAFGYRSSRCSVHWCCSCRGRFATTSPSTAAYPWPTAAP